MSTLELKISSQSGRLLRHLAANPSRWFLPHEFIGSNSDCPFIGYKAPTRLCEMQKAGFVTSRWSDEMRKRGVRMKEYAIAPSADIRCSTTGFVEATMREYDATVQPALL